MMPLIGSGYPLIDAPIRVRRRVDTSNRIRPLREQERLLLIIVKIEMPFSVSKLFVPRALLLFALGASWHGRSFDDSGRFTDTRALLLSAGVGAFPLGLIFEQVTALKFTSSGADGGR